MCVALCGLLDSVCRSVWAVRHVCVGLCGLLDSVCRSVWAVRHVCCACQSVRVFEYMSVFQT